NACPTVWNIRNDHSTGATVVGQTIDGKRYVATGVTAQQDGYTWREFYMASTANAVALGWTVADAFTVISTPPDIRIEPLSLSFTGPVTPPAAQPAPAAARLEQGPLAPKLERDAQFGTELKSLNFYTRATEF